MCPGIKSSRIYFIDTKDPNGLSVYKTIEPEELAKVDLSAPHSSHCLGSGDIMISFMGDKEGKVSYAHFMLCYKNVALIASTTIAAAAVTPTTTVTANIYFIVFIIFW